MVRSNEIKTVEDAFVFFKAVLASNYIGVSRIQPRTPEDDAVRNIIFKIEKEVIKREREMKGKK